MNTIPFVDLKQIEFDHKVGQMLPPEIAYRYHALPVASDGKQVTIAMANPEDRKACRIVKSLIHAPVFLIQADNDEIEYLLQQLWPQDSHPLKFLFWSLEENKNQALDFTKEIAETLGAELEQIESPIDEENFYEDLACCLKKWKTDLIVLQALNVFQVLRKLVKRVKPYSLPDILILPAIPKLPLQNLLMVIDGKMGSGSGITWALRLSKIHQVALNMLPVLPPFPPCYGSLLFHDLAAIKAGNDPLGKDLRAQSKRLKEKNIKVVCTLRCGDSYDQIRQEIHSTDPDLIILPAITMKGRLKWDSIDILQILFKYSSKPILITH
jgi:hypothetical protein